MSPKQDDIAWQNQSRSLVEVQRYGSKIERDVRNLLDWDGGRVVYDNARNYKVQVDCMWPSLDEPRVMTSITYTNPETPGHSNENKLQLKLGELVLLKNRYPDLRAVLVLGGTEEAWLPYVLKAFEFFYDKVICLWSESGATELERLRQNPDKFALKHEDFWKQLRETWNLRASQAYTGPIPAGLLRYDVLDALKRESGVKTPEEITNPIARHCMIASKDSGSTEWDHFRSKRWSSIEMSRSYFNPQEALVELSLKEGGFKYEGGVAKDVEVPSLLHQLGMKNTKLSEDFILHSKRLDMPVYIQCKSSGGGREQHGKNIQNRTKEQVARGVLYSAKLSSSGDLEFADTRFHWIAVVDGDWGVSRGEPYKYIHMLQMAGYKRIFGASSLTDTDLTVLPAGNNQLIQYLQDIECVKLRAARR